MTAIYVRQSADRADSVSLETQEALCRRELAAGEAAAVYADRGCSGKDTDRPALQRLLADIRAGLVTRLLVYKLDRISRNLADFTQLLRLFQTQGVAFSSHTERFETGMPMGQAMQSLLMVFAQLERETISGRVRDAAFARARLGFDTGGAPPFGFCRERAVLHGKRTSVLMPDEHAEAVRGIFPQYLQASQSLRTLAAQWNGAGILTARGGQWTAASLCRLLRNPVYVQADAAVYAYLSARGAELCVTEPLPQRRGVSLFADRRRNHSRFTDLHGVLAIPAQHTGLIAPEIWLSCQQKLEASQKKRTSGRAAGTWLSGRIFCARCGSAMTPVRGRSRYYLVCGGKKRGICEGAGAVWQLCDAEALVSAVLRERMQMLSAYGRMPEETDCRAELDSLRLRRERLLRALTDSDEAAAAELAEAAARLSDRIRRIGHDAENAVQPLQLPAWDALSPAEKKTAAALMLRGVFAEGAVLHTVLQ